MNMDRGGDMASNTWQDWCSPEHLVAETVFFLFKIGEALLEPTARLYISEGVCLQEFSNESSTCYQLSRFPHREDHVQKIAANYLMYYKMILNLPALFLALFCGAWSDRVGRKLPIMLSSFGTIVAVIFFMISLFVMRSSPKAFLPFVFVAAAVRGAFGKSTVMTMAIHSHISDISSKQSRTQKLAKLLSMNYFGYFAGSLLAGALLVFYEFDFVFGTVIFVNCACVLTTIFFMRESVPIADDNGAFIGRADQDFEDDENVKKTNGRLSRIPFRLMHLKESMDVVTKARPRHVRLYILFLFGIIFLQQACKSGEVDITVLYTEKSPLSWSRSMYGYLLAVDYACLGLASAFLLPCLIRFLGVDDMTLAAVGVLFKILRLAMIAYGRYTWLIYLSVVIGCPSAMIISGAKSLISKMVGEDEIGKTFSLLSCGETIANLVGTLAFTGLYANTVDIYPGLTYAADAGLMVFLLFAVLVLAWDMRRTDAVGLVSALSDTTGCYGTIEGEATTSMRGSPDCRIFPARRGPKGKGYGVVIDRRRKPMFGPVIESEASTDDNATLEEVSKD